ncbi:hypothetical protein [Thalassomonas sp. RHCl1]|uniref:hypothetical protein n=1 Tax=Thalassomonas sp. RHCl1 TaxID=2995320 RepID=UPI00248B8F2A|nr:hypothetical protein [Thalassomonas sp. RHCl1]
MKNEILKSMIKAFALSISCFIASVNAGLFTLDHSNPINPLTLSESFTAFYDYGSPNRSSANTGYEQEATAVMFLAEYDEQLALFTLLDAKGGERVTRTADMTISDFNLSDVLLVDDSGESHDSGFQWRWFKCCTDGMIYRIRNQDKFALDISFTDIVGLNSFKFLSFPDDVSSPEELPVGTSFSIQGRVPGQPSSVPEPSALLIFACGVIAVALIRLKMQA